MARDPVYCPDCGAQDFSCRPEVTGGVVILSLEEQQRRAEGMASVIVADRVYLDGNGVATLDPEKGVTLWATPGTEVLEEEAARVGYQLSAFPEEMPKAKAVKRPGGTKVVEGPGGDK